MIDTTEAGAGSYPEPPEPIEKCYTFNCDISCKGNISVYAESFEEAEDLLKSGEYGEEEYYAFNIEDINSYNIED